MSKNNAAKTRTPKAMHRRPPAGERHEPPTASPAAGNSVSFIVRRSNGRNTGSNAASAPLPENLRGNGRRYAAKTRKPKAMHAYALR